MKVKFNSPKARMDFANLSKSNKAIAEYMKDDTHEAVNYNNGDICLVDCEGVEIIVNDDGNISENGRGWYVTVFMNERPYFHIEGE